MLAGTGTGPGTARQRKANKGKAGREGKEGRKERKEEKKEQASGAERSRPVARMDRWIDGQRREQENERRQGREGRRQNQKREGNERVSWKAAVEVCFIDRTW